ncbi:MAG TPA: LamG domain-containing protein, partial [Flavobacterium sp.]|uniref:LamG domain-containing protein n=1 Tax=Flavobacterium sp. TaxID=239 RepID=UPI002DBF38A0
MKKYIIVLLASLAVLSCKTKKDPAPEPTPIPTPVPNSATEILSFGFNESSGQSLDESKTKSSFTINGPLNSAERIVGIEGNALRVNGYYGWATGNAKVTYPTSQVCISGWIAPSAFPVQRKDLDPITENTNAAIFSNVNTTNSSGVAFGINHHGRLIGQFKVGTQLIQILSDKEIELKKWNFLALNINAGQGIATLFLNGVKIKDITFPGGALSWDNNATIYIGKESKNKTVAGFDTNGLTGAIDKVSVWNKNLTSAEILAQFSAVTPSLPILKIPTERFAND